MKKLHLGKKNIIVSTNLQSTFAEYFDAVG